MKPKELTEQKIRANIVETQRELARIEAERDALKAMEAGLEGWLRLHPEGGTDGGR